jgi:hypothetical protein
MNTKERLVLQHSMNRQNAVFSNVAQMAIELRSGDVSVNIDEHSNTINLSYGDNSVNISSEDGDIRMKVVNSILE